MLGLKIADKIGLGKIAEYLILQKKSYQLKQFLRRNKELVKNRKKQKVFVIGFNKTGTTSIEKTLIQFGYIMGHQRTGEFLFDDISEGKYESLIEFCKSAEAFQDVPFSFPDIYKTIDQHYPNSKYILTVRDSSEQWYNSMVKFHSKIWNDGKIPTKEVLANTDYVYKGYPLNTLNFVYGDEIYDQNKYIQVYKKHNIDVLKYFKERPNDLICINISKDNDYQRLCAFLNVSSNKSSFYWENKTN